MAALCPKTLKAKMQKLKAMSCTNTAPRQKNKDELIKRLQLIGSLLLIVCSVARAQVPTSNVQALKVGDQVPENFWQEEHSINQNGKTKLQTLKPYQGKLLVLDFWASWCAPCVAALPKLDSLNQTFKGQLQILSVSYQSEKELAPLVAKVPQLKTLVNEKVLHQLFPHVYLPHLVWIASDGKVLAITGQDALTKSNLLNAGRGMWQNEQQKTDQYVPYDGSKLLPAQAHADLRKQLRFSSSLSQHLPGLVSQSTFKELDGVKGYHYVATNTSLMGLFAFAYSNLGIVNFNQVLNETKTPLKLIATKKEVNLNDWIKDNTYNFELLASAPLVATQPDFFKLLRQQLAIYFPAYQSELIQQKKTVWALTATGSLASIRSKGDNTYFKKDASGYYLRNFSLKSLVRMLNLNTFQKSDIPLVDDTNFSSTVDLDIVADMSDIEAINLALTPYQLQFVKKEMEVPYLRITDSLTPQLKSKL